MKGIWILVLCILLLSNVEGSFRKKKKELTLEEKQAAQKRIGELHNEIEKRAHKMRTPEKQKHKHVPTRHELLNVDHRIRPNMQLLLPEKERKMFASYPECDLDRFPTLSVGDAVVNTVDQLIYVLQGGESEEVDTDINDDAFFK